MSLRFLLALRRLWVGVGAVCALGCGSSGGDPGDAATEVYGHKALDAAGYEAEPPETGPWNRMTQHQGIVLPSPSITIIYIGQSGPEPYQNFDPLVGWMLGSADYWSILAQYGVGFGTLVGSVEFDVDAFFPPGMVQNGVVAFDTLRARVEAVIHPVPDDAGDDGGSGTLPQVPTANGYLVFLPDGVNVYLGPLQGNTCGGVGGYHDYDSVEPFAVIPPCGRNGFVISHEVAEMCTDPIPDEGWFSYMDQQQGGGEIGDLCEYNFVVKVDGNSVTTLWSNKDGQCMPAE
jgi:hypothetical protein